MTDRLKGLMVVLEEPIREDDVEVILQAIKMIKGVADVKPSIDNSEDWMNRTIIQRELIAKVYSVLTPK